MMANPDIRHLAEQLMAEVVRAARQDGERLSPCQGRHLPETLIPHMLEHTAQMTPTAPA